MPSLNVLDVEEESLSRPVREALHRIYYGPQFVTPVPGQLVQGGVDYDDSYYTDTSDHNDSAHDDS